MGVPAPARPVPVTQLQQRPNPNFQTSQILLMIILTFHPWNWYDIIQFQTIQTKLN